MQDQGADSAAATEQRPEGGSLDPRLVMVTEEPLNAETPLQEHQGVLTESALHFRRNRFTRPRLSLDGWQLRVEGEVERPLSLGYDDVLLLPARTLTVTLECAGNGRRSFSPPAEGEPWGFGAVSTAEWTGVPLTLVLREAGILTGAREVVATGADGGTVDATRGRVPFARGLPLEKALHPDTLLAYQMNGEPLPADHGFPLRLLVPGWYGMASVKWLTHVAVSSQPFEGFFQVERYVVPAEDGSEMLPLREMAPRSLIVSPAEAERVPAGEVRVRGLAWSGSGPVTRVEVSTDGGECWVPAEWTTPEERYAWRGWEYIWQASPGETTLQSRAVGSAGNVQPAIAPWNRLGYANNAIQQVRILVG